MIELTNTNAKTTYTYKRYNCTEFFLFPQKLTRLIDRDTKTVSVGRGKYAHTFIEVYGGFDIETTTTDTNNGFMYIWQMSINHNVIIGRTWAEFDQFLGILEQELELASNRKLLLFVANLGFEFQFIRKHLNITDYFLKDKRTPLKVEHNNCIVFMECLTISGGSLSYLAETYTNTQKCVNDLDYDIPRNSDTILTEVEMSYVDNDVLILAEWSQYYFDFYIKGGCGVPCLPMTMASTIRQDIKALAKDYFQSKGIARKNIGKMILSMYPQERTYHEFMYWGFRGGYVHGNILHVGQLFTPRDNVKSFDFTSSYPSCFYNYFPSRMMLHTDPNTIEWYLETIKHKCVIAYIEFINIESTTFHSIESKSKCYRLENELIDNGRVRKASKMCVILTEVDFRIYQRFYKWESMVIHKAFTSNRIPLPDYVKKPMEHDYTEKSRRKALHLSYAVPKARVNTYYGVMVSRLVEQNLTMVNGDAIETDADPYTEQVSRTVLLPTWGMYITSWGRYNITSVLWSICKTDGVGADVLYIDTDSIKIRNADKYQYIIDNYNYRMIKRNKHICKTRGLDFDIFGDLGCLDYEGKCFWLKYLGAKRYLYTHYNAKKMRLCEVQTIAGLPKSTLSKLYDNRDELYNAFQDDMAITQCGKLTTHYNDDETAEYITDEQGHTVLMHEHSNIGLSKSDFTMTLDRLWIDYFLQFQSEYETKEKRA